jgi:hypothetical protein
MFLNVFFFEFKKSGGRATVAQQRKKENGEECVKS